ncbi:MlaE family ABC transporter permease [Prosthecomicrobium sp. N25]|uniref:MlaE family ABC transporter permease n=1 Tax=Prosthecomicrobium sp. N25 TaxID=3129254 RepID=UPI003077F3AA
MAEGLLDWTAEGDRIAVRARGAWTAANASVLEPLVGGVEARRARALAVDVAGIGELDTFGAWLVERLVRSAGSAELSGLKDDFRGLYEKVAQANRRQSTMPPPARGPLAWLGRVGLSMAEVGTDLGGFVAMLGAIATVFVKAVVRPARLRLTALVHHLDRVALQAVPIIVLVTFLIGGIIAQQGFFHFRKFGAEDYVVDMVGILVLREIGVLIVAIMVAGRSGSSYTAELGSMKMREEIDALSTMGRDPIEILILPRVLALVIGLPILAFIGSMAALYGGLLVAWFYGGMDQTIFVARLKEAISLTHFNVGMIKAPFMALVIGTVACSEGIKVKGSAESLGLRTTASVVKSIFLVIVLDGIFAIFFASIGM